MKYYLICMGLLCIGVHLATAQVKIGENLQAIDGASLLELESTSKAFVLTRVSQTEMNAISPLHGALVYNTDANCVFVFDGAVWKSLCDSDSMTSLVQKEEMVFVANDGQNQFSTPLAITDNQKIDVYRNGIKIGFTVVGTNTIELGPEATCFQNDEIRIVQFF